MSELADFKRAWSFCPKCDTRYGPKLEFHKGLGRQYPIADTPCCEHVEIDHMHAVCIICGYEMPMKTADAPRTGS